MALSSSDKITAAYAERHVALRAAFSDGRLTTCAHLSTATSAHVCVCAAHDAPPGEATYVLMCGICFSAHVEADQHGLCELHPEDDTGRNAPAPAAEVLTREPARGLGLPSQIQTTAGTIPVCIEGLVGLCEYCDASWLATRQQRADAFRLLSDQGRTPVACAHVLDGAVAFVPLNTPELLLCAHCTRLVDAGILTDKCQRCDGDNEERRPQPTRPTPLGYLSDRAVRPLAPLVLIGVAAGPNELLLLNALSAAVYDPVGSDDEDVLRFTGAVHLAADPCYCTACLREMRLQHDQVEAERYGYEG